MLGQSDGPAVDVSFCTRFDSVVESALFHIRGLCQYQYLVSASQKGTRRKLIRILKIVNMSENSENTILNGG